MNPSSCTKSLDWPQTPQKLVRMIHSKFPHSYPKTISGFPPNAMAENFQRKIPTRTRKRISLFKKVFGVTHPQSNNLPCQIFNANARIFGKSRKSKQELKDETLKLKDQRWPPPVSQNKFLACPENSKGK